MAARTLPVSATQAAGNKITSALWNAGPVASNTFLLSKPFGSELISFTSLANNTVTAPSSVSITVDTDGGFSASPAARYTARVAGWYAVMASTGFANIATTGGSVQVFVRKNGSDVFATNASQAYTSVASNLVEISTPFTLVQLAVGDFVEPFVLQNTGATLNSFSLTGNFLVLFVSS